MSGWKNNIGFLFYYIDFFYNLLYNYYRIKKRDTQKTNNKYSMPFFIEVQSPFIMRLNLLYLIESAMCTKEIKHEAV